LIPLGGASGAVRGYAMDVTVTQAAADTAAAKLQAFYATLSREEQAVIVQILERAAVDLPD
jgi:hypothetical protein